MRSFTREKVLEFYQRALRAPEHGARGGRATSPEAAAARLGRGALRRRLGPPVRWRPGAPAQEPAQPGRAPGRARTMRRRPTSTSRFPIPAADHEDTPALDVLAMIARPGRDSSRLALEVKRKRALVNEIHAYAYTPEDPGPVRRFDDRCRRETSSTRRSRPAAPGAGRSSPRRRSPDDELATVKALIEAEAVYQRETVQGLARKLGYYESALGRHRGRRRATTSASPRLTPARCGRRRAATSTSTARW